MQIFTFDKFWNLFWTKEQGYVYSCKFENFIITANKEKVSSPKFAIYRDAIADENCIVKDLDSDLIIMQLKSIQETGKIAIR